MLGGTTTGGHSKVLYVVVPFDILKNMPTFKNKLDELLAEAVLAVGITRRSIIEQIRTYLTTTPVETLRSQIAEITAVPSLRMLQAAGVPKDLQDIFFFVWNRLTTAAGVR